MRIVLDYLAGRLGYVRPRRARRAYSGAQQTRLTSSWNTTAKPSDVDIRAGLRALRSRSRDQLQNSDYVRKFIAMVRSKVVGSTGIVMQARAVGDDGELDTLANAAIENAWREWGELGSPDLTGTKTWWDLQREFIGSVATDGEALIERVPGAENVYGYALNTLDPEMLDVDYNRKLGDGRWIVMGVELNSSRRPVAYHLRVNAPGSNDFQVYNGKTYRSVPADRILHRYVSDLVQQTRGVPWCASALLRLGMLTGYEEAAVVGARLAASSMGFIEKNADGQGFTGDGEKNADGDFLMDAEPGVFRNLPPGTKLSTWSPDHPHTGYGEFMKVALRGISSGPGVSYNGLANDLEGVNFSSLRAGVLEERELWMSLQRWTIDHFAGPVYRDWLRQALTTQAIRVGGRPLKFGLERKYQRVFWQGRRWAWVDPKKDEEAANLALANRTRSRSSVIREKGGDPDSVWQEIASDDAAMLALGITPADVAAAPAEPRSEEDERAELLALIASMRGEPVAAPEVNVTSAPVTVNMPTENLEQRIGALADALELDQAHRLELQQAEEHRRAEDRRRNNQILDFLALEGPPAFREFVEEIRGEPQEIAE